MILWFCIIHLNCASILHAGTPKFNIVLIRLPEHQALYKRQAFPRQEPLTLLTQEADLMNSPLDLHYNWCFKWDAWNTNVLPHQKAVQMWATWDLQFRFGKKYLTYKLYTYDHPRESITVWGFLMFSFCTMSSITVHPSAMKELPNKNLKILLRSLLFKSCLVDFKKLRI